MFKPAKTCAADKKTKIPQPRKTFSLILFAETFKIKKNKMLSLLALPTLFSLSGQLQISPHQLLAPTIAIAVKKNMFRLSDGKFKKDDPLRKSEFERAMTALACRDFSMRTKKNHPKNSIVKKSEAVRELSFVITANGERNPDGSARLPENYEKIQFHDIEKKARHRVAAQILAGLLVLDTPRTPKKDDSLSAWFGTPPTADFPGDPDPPITKFQFLRLLRRSFDFKKCNFAVRLDRDGDGILNRDDFCPKIPGSSESRISGCPKFQLRIPKTRSGRGVIVSEGAVSAEIKMREKTDIRPGDEIFATVGRGRQTTIPTGVPSKIAEN